MNKQTAVPGVGEATVRQRVFLCQTLYHALLSSCIAAEHGDPSENILIFMPNIYRAEDLFLKLVPGDKAPFRRVDSLLATNPRSRLSQWALERLALSKVREIAREHRAGEVYVFNDSSPCVQYFGRSVPQECPIHYVEDGLSAYSSWCFKKSARRSVALRLFYGAWYRRPIVLGTSRRFDSVHATFPDHVRAEIVGVPVVGISPRFALTLRPEPICDIPDVLLMPAFSGHIANPVLYARQLSEFVEWLLASGVTVGIKYHPVEDPRRYLDLPRGQGVVVLPQHVPVEMLLLSAQRRIKCLIGDASTGLLAARWLFNDMLVVCAGGLRGVDQDPVLKSTFRSVGIQEAADVRVLRSICTDHFRKC